jgi:hypothetical protein
MVRFGATNFTFDLEEFYVFGWTERIGNPPTLTMTIRTNKMGQKAYPYALPIRNGQGELMKVGSALGDIMQGIKWVELAVWRAWDWTKPGVEGNPVMGWTMDDILVRKRKSCGEPGSEWEQLRKRGIVW